MANFANTCGPAPRVWVAHLPEHHSSIVSLTFELLNHRVEFRTDAAPAGAAKISTSYDPAKQRTAQANSARPHQKR